MMGFLVFMQINILNITVEVGFVTGITARIGPRGWAISIIPE
jgi:hypothetical protein